MSLRVMALVPHPPAGASGRYRVYQMQEPLARMGIELEPRPFLGPDAFERLYRPGSAVPKAIDLLRGARGRWGDLAAARRFDVVLVHRELWPMLDPGVLERLHRHQPRFLYDFDDAVFLPNVSDANRRFAWLKPADQPRRLAAEAVAVSAGNAWLADWARRVRRGGAGGVTVVPTSVDTRRWTPGHAAGGPPRLVWTGSHSTVQYLESVRPPLESLARRHPFELHVMGASFRSGAIRVVEHDWSEEAERELVRAGQIGLSPLAPEEWALGKCGLKLLIYMAAGLPAVASSVGVHREIVASGENGLLAEDPGEFGEAVERLIVDRALRERLGRAARATVEARYALDRVAPLLAGALREAAEATPHR